MFSCALGRQLSKILYLYHPSTLRTQTDLLWGLELQKLWNKGKNKAPNPNAFKSRKQCCSNFVIITDFQTLVSWPSRPNLTFHFFKATETQLTLRVSNLLGVAPALLLLVAGLLLPPSSPITGLGLFCTIFSMSCKAIWCSDGSEIPAFSIELPWFRDPRNNSNTAVCKKIDCSKHSTPGDIDML